MSRKYYFYYKPQNVVDYVFLSTMTEKADGMLIYIARCSFIEDELAKIVVTFKEILRAISRL